MSTYNTVTGVQATCPRCRGAVSIGVQFKFGATWQYRYSLGDALCWGKNDIGTPGQERVVADGAAESPCPACGFVGDWDFHVFIERDRIMRVTQADGTHDFLRAGCTYLSDSGGRLGFADSAARAFAFLLQLGFVIVRREGTFLRFEGHNVFVNVYHGSSSFHVGLEIGRVHDGDLYSLYEVLSAVAPNDVDRARCQTTEREALERCLMAIAESVERNCGGLLAGDEGAFEHLRSKVATMRKATTLKAQFGPLIDRADEAWERKDLTAAADLYGKAEEALDEPRRRRLKYLRSRAWGL